VVKSPPLKSITSRMGTDAFVRPRRAKLGSPSRPVQFNGKKLSSAIYSREALTPGKKYSGPAIITEYSATIVIPTGKHFSLDGFSNLIVTIP
jgi:N-methylhydantoinase A